MRIYLGDLELPVAPEQLDIRLNGDWKNAALSELGEVSLYRPPKLRVIRFSGIFPAQRYAFVTAERFLQPAIYAEQIEKMARGKEAIRLVVGGGGRPFSMPVTIAGFRWYQQAGEEDDLYYELELQEYREFGKTAIPSTPGAIRQKDGAIPQKNPAAPVSYTVKRGDTLWAIAKKFLGNGGRYPELAAYNGIKNPNRIYVGQVIRIP